MPRFQRNRKPPRPLTFEPVIPFLCTACYGSEFGTNYVILLFNKELGTVPTVNLTAITLRGSVVAGERATTDRTLVLVFADDWIPGNIVDIPESWGLTSIDNEPIAVHIGVSGTLEYLP